VASQDIKRNETSNRMNDSFDELREEDACSLGEVEVQDSANNLVEGHVLAPRLFVVDCENGEAREYLSQEQIKVFAEKAERDECFSKQEEMGGGVSSLS